MPVVLENAILKKIDEVAIDSSTALLSDGESTTPFSAACAAGAVISSSTAAAQLAKEIGPTLIKQVVGNVTSHVAAKLGETVADLLTAPSPATIVSQAAGLVKDYLVTAGDLMKELMSDSESNQEKDALEKQKESCKQVYADISEKVANMKEKVSKVLEPIETNCQDIVKYIEQGSTWVVKKLDDIEEKAIKESDKFIDEQAAVIKKQKEEFIESMSIGLAKQKAEDANNKLRTTVKEKIDKIKIQKEILITKAKAAIGKALLKLMAMLGM